MARTKAKQTFFVAHLKKLPSMMLASFTKSKHKDSHSSHTASATSLLNNSTEGKTCNDNENRHLSAIRVTSGQSQSHLQRAGLPLGDAISEEIVVVRADIFFR